MEIRLVELVKTGGSDLVGTERRILSTRMLIDQNEIQK
jgi:hypothetical protein